MSITIRKISDEVYKVRDSTKTPQVSFRKLDDAISPSLESLITANSESVNEVLIPEPPLIEPVIEGKVDSEPTVMSNINQIVTESSFIEGGGALGTETHRNGSNYHAGVALLRSSTKQSKLYAGITSGQATVNVYATETGAEGWKSATLWSNANFNPDTKAESIPATASSEGLLQSYKSTVEGSNRTMQIKGTTTGNGNDPFTFDTGNSFNFVVDGTEVLGINADRTLSILGTRFDPANNYKLHTDGSTSAFPLANAHDINAMMESGIYMINGSSLTPDNGWWYLKVDRHYNTYMRQTVSSLSNSAINKTYSRLVNSLGANIGEWQEELNETHLEEAYAQTANDFYFKSEIDSALNEKVGAISTGIGTTNSVSVVDLDLADTGGAIYRITSGTTNIPPNLKDISGSTCHITRYDPTNFTQTVRSRDGEQMFVRGNRGGTFRDWFEYLTTNNDYLLAESENGQKVVKFDSNTIVELQSGAMVTSATWSANGVGSNVDHIWHDDGGNVWHFCSDVDYKATGNSTLKAGQYLFTDGTSVGDLMDSKIDAVVIDGGGIPASYLSNSSNNSTFTTGELVSGAGFTARLDYLLTQGIDVEINSMANITTTGNIVAGGSSNVFGVEPVSGTNSYGGITCHSQLGVNGPIELKDLTGQRAGGQLMHLDSDLMWLGQKLYTKTELEALIEAAFVARGL